MSTPLVEQLKQLKSVLESLKAIDSVPLFEKYGFNYDSITAFDKSNFNIAVNEVRDKSNQVLLLVANESNFSDFQIESVKEFVSVCRKKMLDRDSFADSSEILSALREISGALSPLIIMIGEFKGIIVLSIKKIVL